MDEFKQRFTLAKRHRVETIENAGAREVYKFCFNGRESEWDGRTVNADPEEIFTDIPAMVAENFYGELFTTMTPENRTWVEYETMDLPQDVDPGQAERQIAIYEQLMAKSVRGSNYYTEGQTAYQDAVVGTVCYWVERFNLNGRIVIEAVPLPQVYLRLGPMGIDDRFRVQKYAYKSLEAMFPGAKWPKEIARKIKDGNTRGRATVNRGFWLDYSDPEDIRWKQAVRVDDRDIGLDRILDESGEMPLVVGRFNPRPGWAYGWGPGLRALPAMRVLDELARMNLEGMDRTLDPAYVYPHDGILDLSNGVEAGIGYPAMPGSSESIRALGLEGALDYGYFSEERLTEFMRESFYQSVTQRGKTPPSASQYIGEEQKDLRRMARPAGKLWEEAGVGLLKRMEHLERQSGGLLEGLQAPLIEDGIISPRPISPLERATAREDVLTAQSIMSMAFDVLQEQTPMILNAEKTLANIKSKLNDQLVEFRTEDEIRELMQQQQGMPDEQPQG